MIYIFIREKGLFFMKFNKKTVVSVIISLALIVCCASSVPMTANAADTTTKRVINGVEYVETFSDEFDGTSLDRTKWNYCPEWSRQGGYCYWDNDMTSVDGDGHLILKAAYDDSGVLRCGAIRTRDLFDQTNGYFEIKVKLQSKPGFWSAFWLMPYNIDTGIEGGSDGTEIDVYEAFSVERWEINHAVHFDGYGSNHRSIGKAITKAVYDGEYHTFAVDWSKDAYTFYIDGVQTYQLTYEDCDISRVKSYMKISLESGSWTGLPNKSDMPDSICVDYVKAYQRSEYVGKPADPLPQTLYGDANDDGRVNMKDILIIRKFHAGQNVTINQKATDVNKDKKINMKDILAIRKHIAGYKLAPWD